MSKWLWPDAIEAVIGFSQSSCAADSGGNWQGALLPKVDAAFAAFLRAGSLAELQEESRNVQEVFMSELAYIPLPRPWRPTRWPRASTAFPCWRGRSTPITDR